jgi:hypothetical protein
MYIEMLALLYEENSGNILGENDPVQFISSELMNSRDTKKILSLGILRLCFLDNFFFESYDFPYKARGTFKREIINSFHKLKIIRNENLQTFEVIGALKSEFERITNRLDSIINTLEKSNNFESFENSRTLLVKELKAISPFLLPSEFVVENFINILVLQLSNYVEKEHRIASKILLAIWNHVHEVLMR